MSECEICHYEGDIIQIREFEDNREKLVICSKCGHLKEKQIWRKEVF